MHPGRSLPANVEAHSYVTSWVKVSSQQFMLQYFLCVLQKSLRYNLFMLFGWHKKVVQRGISTYREVWGEIHLVIPKSLIWYRRVSRKIWIPGNNKTTGQNIKTDQNTGQRRAHCTGVRFTMVETWVDTSPPKNLADDKSWWISAHASLCPVFKSSLYS